MVGIFHVSRHTFATTISLMNGVPLIALSKMLGHKSITTTQIYAKVTESMIDQAITTINDKISGKYSF
ncbi:tyrosine-type recombinase/integrase [Alistipes shahii]|uniref:Site-specific recombinase XerD n=1 Tax=Alistipes shahii WAL 8301 TaxID=717959 RepID=D4IKI8_9BACT|nr:Site-specific recombinase XerD [Alistipes shahii WAL 8301]